MTSSDDPSPWWDASRHADRRSRLLARAAIKRAIRAWFEGHGFVEIDAGCLQVSPGNETHLHAFKTELIGTDLARRALYLHTSPEFAMKKLLAAGEEKIFTFAPAFRNREQGALHAPEFTMLEWYRAREPYETLFDDCAAILKIAAEAAGAAEWSYADRSCDPAGDYDVVTLDQAFGEHAAITLQDTYSSDGANRDALADAARAAGFTVRPDHSWSDIFSFVLADTIEPKLGVERPTILCSYPMSEAALARPAPDDPAVSERFELYACGIELANGFGELTDADVQRARFEAWMAEKQRIYGERYPIDEGFLTALRHMPPAAGCALGFDRLVMLATGAARVEDVIWTPLD
ncbi:MAG: EF-P lysine aminoacylase EpmA [Hyphomicrobium sp.]